MEEHLRESDEMFTQLATNIDGYFWLNAPDDSRFYYLSPGFEKITGQSPESLYHHLCETLESDAGDRGPVLAVVEASSPLFGKRQHARSSIASSVQTDTSGSVGSRDVPSRPGTPNCGEVYRVAGLHGEDVTDRSARGGGKEFNSLSRKLLTVQEEGNAATWPANYTTKLGRVSRAFSISWNRERICHSTMS